ncbi:MAG: response regulator [Acidobacteria bacterium]|nr:response regulator [Acidobacteriota bacterium]
METKCILIVDDDPSVLRFMTHVLTRFGYSVVPVSSPEQALSAFTSQSRVIDMVISDVIMPRMTGPDLIERIRAERPDVPVLFTSGFSSTDLVQSRVVQRGMALLDKPFSIAALLSKTREMLEGRQAGAG